MWFLGSFGFVEVGGLTSERVEGFAVSEELFPPLVRQVALGIPWEKGLVG